MRPASLAAWAGRQVLCATGRIDAAAQRVGDAKSRRHGAIHRVGLDLQRRRPRWVDVRMESRSLSVWRRSSRTRRSTSSRNSSPLADERRGGRRRQYPEHMWLIYEALLSVFGSARQVEAELSHPTVWGLLRDRVRRQFPKDPSRWLPGRADASPPLSLRPQPLPHRPRRPRRSHRAAPRARRQPGPRTRPPRPGRSRIVDPSRSVTDGARRRQSHHAPVSGPARRHPTRHHHR